MHDKTTAVIRTVNELLTNLWPAVNDDIFEMLNVFL